MTKKKKCRDTQRHLEDNMKDEGSSLREETHGNHPVLTAALVLETTTQREL